MADYNLLTFDALKSNLPPVSDLSTNTIEEGSLLTFDKLRGFPSTGEMSQSTSPSDYADSTGNKWDIATDQLSAAAYDGIGLIADIVGADDNAAEWR